MPPITPQPGIMEIGLYVGGKSAIDGRNDVLKLSSNENPLGPSKKVVAALLENGFEDAHRYNYIDPLIEAIARQAVSENDTWVNQAEFDEPKRKNDGSGWSVLVWRLPKTPGGHRSTEIDPNGKVIAYHRGR